MLSLGNFFASDHKQTVKLKQHLIAILNLIFIISRCELIIKSQSNKIQDKIPYNF